jgi:hypothetical protein
VILLTVLAVLITGLLIWAYKAGKKSSLFDQAKNSIRKSGEVNEFNRKEDKTVERQIGSAGDNPVRGPWLRDRD